MTDIKQIDHITDHKMTSRNAKKTSGTASGFTAKF